MNRISVLLSLRFTDAQIERVRAISPRLVVAQKSLKEGADFSDTSGLFEGDEEIFYGMIPPCDLSRAPRLKWVQLHSAGINHLTH